MSLRFTRLHRTFRFCALVLMVSCSSSAPDSSRRAATNGEPTRVPAAIPGISPQLDADLWERVTGDRSSSLLLKFFAFADETGLPQELYFQDPERYEFHYQALQNFAPYRGASRKDIEKLSAKNAGRRLYLGVYEHPIKGDNDNRMDTSFYVMGEDLPSARHLKALQNLLVNAVTAEGARRDLEGQGLSKINLRPLSHQRNAAIAQEKELHDLGIAIDTATRGSSIEAYNDGWSYGPLVVVESQADLDAKLKAKTVAENNVLLVKTDLRELPPVAGVIAAVPLINASHLVLLAQMYGIPLAFDQDAVAHLSAAAGKTVFFATSLARPNEYEIAVDIADAAAAKLATLRATKKLEVKLDLQPTSVVRAKDLSFATIAAYGGKASQFGLLQKNIERNARRYAAGIPVSYSRAFYEAARSPVAGQSLWKWIQESLKNIPPNASYFEIDEALGQIRDQIKKTEVPPATVEKIRTDLAKLLDLKPDGTGNEIRVKLRSSSNVEDGAEFNGAGLYDSKGACLLQCEKAEPKDLLGPALNKVWRSLYTTRGYWARRKFLVPESAVAMGVLVHAPYKGEEANGVIRTRRVRNFDGTYSAGSEIIGAPGGDEETVDGGGGLVTGGGSGARPEVIRIEYGRLSEVQSFENRPSGSLLLEKAQYQLLHDLMTTLYKVYPNEDGLEIEAEWKLLPKATFNNVVQIKQVRRVPRNSLSLPNGNQFLLLAGRETRVRSVDEIDLQSGPYGFFRPEAMALRGLTSGYDSELVKAKRMVVPEIEFVVNGKAKTLKQVAFDLTKRAGGNTDNDATYTWTSGELAGFHRGTTLEIGYYFHPNSPKLVATSGPTVSYTLKFAADSLPGLARVGSQARFRYEALGQGENVAGLKNRNLIREVNTPRIVGRPGQGVWGSYTLKVKSCGYDDCAYVVDRLKLNGLLPTGRVLDLAPHGYAMQDLRKHEHIISGWIDFALLDGIADADRATILKNFGRYLFRHDTRTSDNGASLTDELREDDQSPLGFFFVSETGVVKDLKGQIIPWSAGDE